MYRHIDADGLAITKAGLEALGSTFRFVLSVIHDDNSAAEFFYLLHVMGGVDDCGSLLIHLTNAFKDCITALGINCNGRLIKEDKFWLMGDSASVF